MLVKSTLHLTEKKQVLPYSYLYFKTSELYVVREAKLDTNFQKIGYCRFLDIFLLPSSLSNAEIK